MFPPPSASDYRAYRLFTFPAVVMAVKLIRILSTDPTVERLCCFPS